MRKFEHLFSPIKIRGNTYRNRLIAAPTMFSHFVLFYPEIAENVYRMCEDRAKGGFAAVSTGEIPVNNEEGTALYMERAVDYTDYKSEDFFKMKEYSDRIKKHGALSYMEFCHEGSMAETKFPYEPWGPDNYIREDGVEVKALTQEMMTKVCNDYRNIAKFAKRCGFSGVLVHGGHGFNMQQFISPLTNHRKDEFGGSMENRAKFPLMLLDAVREGIGEDMILELRFSAEDGVSEGMTIDDTVEFCKIIDGRVDIIHVSNGLKWAGNMTQTFSDFFDIHGVNVEFAKKIKEAVKISKVSVIGGINDPLMCEEIIASGKADFVEMGRQCFADPNLPLKAQTGKEDYIRKCVRCFSCYPGFCEHKTDMPLEKKGMTPEEVRQIYRPGAMGHCAINPKTGFFYYADREPKPTGSRKVLIIGGGVGGLQSAITCIERGHRVTLVEKSNVLGGLINFTDQDGDKVDLRNFKNLLIRETQECGAKILMNTPISKEIVDEEKPDAIIIAVGGHPIVPKILGIENAITAIEVYDRMDKLGKNIVVVGGGLVGCEVGIHMASDGHDVTVVEMQYMMAIETFGYYRNALLDEMDKRNIKQMLNTKCLEFTEKGIRVEQGGKEIFVQADSCVFSMGMAPNKELVESIHNMIGDIKHFVIGDCQKAGKVGDSVRAGYMAAMKII